MALKSLLKFGKKFEVGWNLNILNLFEDGNREICCLPSLELVLLLLVNVLKF